MSKKPSLADIRAKYKQKVEGKKKDFGTNNDVYPHWNIDENASATVRILPDKNEDNEDIFFVDKLEHKLAINGRDRKIPCIKMWGEKCPICELSSKYYKSEGKGSVQGKYYYFKRTSLMKALIIKDPIAYETAGETAVGQVKTLQFTYQLMNLINAALADEDEDTALAALPWDLDEGYSFVIKKTKQGEYDNYSTSAFSNKVTSIPKEYREVVEEGMIDLSTLLPANPGLEAVQKLLEAHLSGDEVEEEEKAEAAPARKKVVEAVDEEEEEIPVKRRKPVEVVEEEEEEAPVIKKRKPIVDEEEEAPAPKKAKPVVVEEEEEEAPVVVKKKSTPTPVAEDDDDEDAALIAKIRARKNA